MTREVHRRVVVCVAILATAVVLSATALGAGGANLNGRFRVKEVVTSTTGRGVFDHVGQRFAYTWTFTPSCRFGSCPTTLASNNGGHIGLASSGSTFTATQQSTTGCKEVDPPYTQLTAKGYTVVGDLRLYPTAVAQGAARRLGGTVTFHYHPTADGKSHNCSPGTEVIRVVATAIPGTVRSAIPPQSRSSIARSLVPIADAFPLNRVTLLNAVVALLAMLLITFPAELFNRTLEENDEEIRDLIRARVPRLARPAVPSRRSSLRRPLVAFFLVMLGGALIGGLNDPSFGFNGHSADTLVAVLLAFSVGVATAAAVGAGYRGVRHMKLSAAPHAIPAGLIIAIVCVLVSRLSHFEPGYLYGVVAGVAFAGELTHRQKGHEVTFASLATLAVATVAWIAWTPVQHAAQGANPSTVVLIADTLLAALFVSGVVATVINLVPVQPLPGKTLFRWHRGVWAGMFVVATFLLVEVMLLPAAHIHLQTKAPFYATVTLFVIFGGVSIGFNRFFARRHRVRTDSVATRR